MTTNQGEKLNQRLARSAVRWAHPGRLLVGLIVLTVMACSPGQDTIDDPEIFNHLLEQSRFERKINIRYDESLPERWRPIRKNENLRFMIGNGFVRLNSSPTHPYVTTSPKAFEAKPSGSGEITVTIAERVINGESVSYRYWSEGSISYASIAFNYSIIPRAPFGRVFEQLDAIEALIIARKHPATDRWELASYEGEVSRITDNAERRYSNVIRQFVAANRGVISARISAARDKAMRLVRSENFPGVSLANEVVDYSKQGLQVAVGAHKWQQNFENARTHCADLSYGGKDDWRLPTKQEVRVFGEGNGRLKDTPDNYFFGRLSNASSFVIWTDKPGDSGHQTSWGHSARHSGFGETPSQGYALSVLCVRSD